MNEKIDLTKILKDCPKGTKLYSTIYGEVEFYNIVESGFYPITVRTVNGLCPCVTKYGMYAIDYEDRGECTLFPSKTQRDWNKFSAPWYKKEKFNPKTLKPFDKVLIKQYDTWFCDLYSYYNEDCKLCICSGLNSYLCCIPYNDDTKHLVGTNDEAPEYYRYWED